MCVLWKVRFILRGGPWSERLKKVRILFLCVRVDMGSVQCFKRAAIDYGEQFAVDHT